MGPASIMFDKFNHGLTYFLTNVALFMKQIEDP